jgi:hypothetical protein
MLEKPWDRQIIISIRVEAEITLEIQAQPAGEDGQCLRRARIVILLWPRRDRSRVKRSNNPGKQTQLLKSLPGGYSSSGSIEFAFAVSFSYTK